MRATDPETGEEGARKVTRLWIHQDELLTLELEDGSQVTTTEDHPFWNDTDQQWQRADELDKGDRLVTADGSTATVDRVDSESTYAGTAFNLTVDDIHTYYVGIGNEQILVHNTETCDLNDVQHVIDRHTLGGVDRDADAGVFDDGVDLNSLATGSSGQIGMRNPNTGNIEYTIKTNSIVGNTGATSGGLPTNTYLIVRDPRDSALITMYPVK